MPPAMPGGTGQATLKEAAEHLRRGDVSDAEALARAALAERPGQPEALRILARCAYERGSARDGLALALEAARSMQLQRVDAANEYLIWSDLGFMFGVALVGIDSALAADRRVAYARRPASRDAELASATVSVVVITTESGERLAHTLRSVAAQTCPDIELIVAYAGADPRSDPDVATAVTAWQRDVRWLPVPDSRAAALAEAGARVATGGWVNVLPVPHRFAPTRVDMMREALARRGAAWGFSGVAFVDPSGASIPAERDWQVRAGMDRLSAISESDTIGHALIHQDFVAVDAGNLMFRRSLHDEIGGFRVDAPLWAWEFCLHAVLEDEPVFVPTREFVHVTVAASPMPPAQRRDYEAAQLGLFGDYYAFACTDTAVRNPFAPCVANWGLGFLKNVFHAGHVLALPLPELERLGVAILARVANSPESALAPGIDLVGFAFGEFGLGENLRAFARACERDAIPFIVRDVDLRLKTRQADRSIAAHVSEVLRHGCALYCLNPDMMKPVRPLLVESAAVGRRNIGYWFWELEQIPAQWAQSIADIDEIWVATEFIATAMRHATDKPVVKIPTPIDVAMSRAYTRSEFGLPDDRFLFLFSFDFNSFAARKNPEAAIRAFQRAFARGRRDVGLVVKSINGRNKPKAVHALRELIGGDDRVVIVDEFFSRDEVSGLQSVVDAYVSLHRAEGLGLGLAESMYLGKPVIGTRYSGNLEFMDDANSCLVDCVLVPIRKGEYLYDDDRFRWAEPDVGQAANWMTRLADDAEFRTRIAERGRNDIRTRFTYANAAALMRRRLSELGLL
jgi:glycosyltransferase involved in cell wall biosynthesis